MLPTAPASTTTQNGIEDVRVDLVVNERAEAFVFHNRPFRKRLAWFEYDLKESRLQFIMNDGDIKEFGIPVDPQLSKYLQNTFQVLTVQMDEKTGEPVEGDYYPLIIHSI